MIDIRRGDCMEQLKTIPDSTVDLILTDPPYNIGKAEWDKIDNYVEWSGRWLKECERVLKDNGTLYWFHNDMPQISKLMEWIDEHTLFKFNSFCIWDKGNWRALSWKHPGDGCKLRSWFNTCEYCLVYTFQDGSGLEKVMRDMNNFKELRDYFGRMQNRIGRNKKQIIADIGGRADHCFRWNSPQWVPPTPETYADIVTEYGLQDWEDLRPYDEIRDEYERLRAEYEGKRAEYESQRYTHNLDEEHNNVWHSAFYNTGKYHPTQKPADILERIIRVSTNEGGLVLDPFMGSGSTGVAAARMNRDFIGFELSEKYYNIAAERIAEAKGQAEHEQH